MVIQDETFIEYCLALKKRYKPSGRVLLVQIPQTPTSGFDREVARNRGYYAYPPTGLQCLAAAIGRRKLETEIVDLNLQRLKQAIEDRSFDPANWLELLRPHLEKFDPGIVGISCMYDSGIASLLKTLEFLRDYGRAIVITGGVISSYENKALLSAGLCHFVVQGEGEYRLNYLLDELTDEDTNSPHTSGIYYMGEDGPKETLGTSDPVQLVSDLIESHKSLAVEEYSKFGSLNPFSRIAAASGAAYATIQMNRGCRGSCTFCSVRDFMGKGVRHRDIDLVLREMEYLVQERGIRHFEWLDDDLLYYKDEFIRLLECIIEKQWEITWSANNGLIAGSIDAQLMELMGESGCMGFKVGVESGNAEVLKRTRKPATIRAFRRLSRLLEDYPEIFVGGNFMLGFVGETFGQMLDTFHLCLELKFDWAVFSVCQAIRGASAFSEFQDYFSEQMDRAGAKVRNFMPSRETNDGTISKAGSVKRNMDIFSLDPGAGASPAQTREIWFSFNLLANYIFNKNLQPCSVADKFIPWVEMAMMAYPHNPYMSLFLSIAYSLIGQLERSREYLGHCTTHCDSPYWRERFSAWGLDSLVHEMHNGGRQIGCLLDHIRNNVPGGLQIAEES